MIDNIKISKKQSDNLNIVVTMEEYIKAHVLTKTNRFSFYQKESILPPTIFMA